MHSHHVCAHLDPRLVYVKLCEMTKMANKFLPAPSPVGGILYKPSQEEKHIFAFPVALPLSIFIFDWRKEGVHAHHVCAHLNPGLCETV